MIRTTLYSPFLAVFAAAFLLAIQPPALAQEGHTTMPSDTTHMQGAPTQHQQAMADMSAMKREPHHVLAMAYQDSLVTFTKALGNQAATAIEIDPAFARAAVAEMMRSFDEMQQHHQDHMTTMDDATKAHMAGMMPQMDAHRSAIQESLAGLKNEVLASAPDARRISQATADILKHCDGMSRMQAGAMDQAMAGSKQRTTN